MSHIKSMLLGMLAAVSFSAVSNGQQCSVNVKCPYHDPLNTGRKDWILAFRATPHIGVKVYNAYRYGTGVPSINDIGCIQVDPKVPCSHHYRNSAVLNNWTGIAEVLFAVYSSRGLAHYIVFDGTGSSYMSWFSPRRVKTSSWRDLKTSSQSFFSIEGYTRDGSERRFYISNAHCGGCNCGSAWVMFNDKDPEVQDCSWLSAPVYPLFRYATGSYAASRPSSAFAEASFIAIFVKYR